MGSAADAPAAASISVDAIWGEQSESLHQAIEAPRLAEDPPVRAEPPELVVERHQPAVRRRQNIAVQRAVARVTLALACLLGVAFALNVDGVRGAPSGRVANAGARHQPRSAAHGDTPVRADRTRAHRARGVNFARPAPLKSVESKTAGARTQAEREPAARRAAGGQGSRAPVRTTAALDTGPAAPTAADGSGSVGGGATVASSGIGTGGGLPGPGGPPAP